jgi:hypothetical protein
VNITDLVQQTLDGNCVVVAAKINTAPFQVRSSFSILIHEHCCEHCLTFNQAILNGSIKPGGAGASTATSATSTAKAGKATATGGNGKAGGAATTASAQAATSTSVAAAATGTGKAGTTQKHHGRRLRARNVWAALSD